LAKNALENVAVMVVVVVVAVTRENSNRKCSAMLFVREASLDVARKRATREGAEVTKRLAHVFCDVVQMFF
jgi:hypothetical protein